MIKVICGLVLQTVRLNPFKESLEFETHAQPLYEARNASFKRETPQSRTPTTLNVIVKTTTTEDFNVLIMPR